VPGDSHPFGFYDQRSPDWVALAGSVRELAGKIGVGAIQQWPGTIGTNGGCRVDKDGRVLGNRVPVIDGLYAVGNTSAAVLGGTYPGGGACIGSSVTMGYRAGRHVATRRPR
jgi:succinate dehydrogenase/fumarate reductase flavoprotein subunit